MEDIEVIEEEQTEPVCPECGCELNFTGRCGSCPECGYSMCQI